MKRWLTALLLTAILSGCTHHSTDAEQRTVSELTTHMTTRGLGRYLIDLPPTWRFGSGEVTLYYGLGTDFKTVEVKIIGQDVTPLQFQAAMAWRAKRIQGVTNDKTRRSMLVGSWPVDVRIDDGQGGKGRQAMLLRYYRRTNGDTSFVHEVHLLLDSTYVQLKAESFNDSDSPGYRSDAVENRLKTLARQIFLVTDPARADPGFILGPIVIDGPQDHEQATVEFYDPQQRDVTLEINSNAVTPDESRHLLQRMDESATLFRERGAHIHTLQRGQRAFAGMRGEEVCIAADSKVEKGQTIRELLFNAETYRPDPSLLKPTLMVQLETGGNVHWDSDAERATRRATADYLMNPKRLPSFIVTDDDPYNAPPPPTPVTSSLTDHEATAVWNAILPTIRPRPGAVAPTKPKEPLSPPPISREQAERDRQVLDDFIASRPGPLPNLED